MNENAVQVYVMSGLPGSGKSTWAARHLPFIPYVSRDDIRFKYLKPGDEYFKYETQVWDDFISQIATIANSGQDVLIDATHINVRSRKKLYRSLKAWLEVDYEINVIFMDVCLSKSIERNESREGLRKVPEDAIRNMFNSMEVPLMGEDTKIKEIWVVRN